MSILRMDPHAVVMRRCPICGHIILQADILRLESDIPCPKCHKVTTDKFGPIYEPDSYKS